MPVQIRKRQVYVPPKKGEDLVHRSDEKLTDHATGGGKRSSALCGAQDKFLVMTNFDSNVTCPRCR
jgi:hypothetical protein